MPGSPAPECNANASRFQRPYLRYPTKRDLALAAVADIPALVDAPDTGDAFDDLTALLARLVVATKAAGGMALTGAVLAEEDEHSELLEQWRATVGTALGAIVERIVENGKNRGQLNVEFNADLVTDLLLGVHLARYTYRGRPGARLRGEVVGVLRPALEA